MSDLKFASGLFANKPNSDKIVVALSFKKEEFIQFLRQQDGETVNVNILTSQKTGKLFGVLNEWKPENPKNPENPKTKNDSNDDLPF